MRIAVISDDLTGASDCGGQLIDYGLNVSVILKWNEDSVKEKDVIVYNSNSRDVSEEEAKQRVKNICDNIKNEPFDVIYKKIDSTMRGNVGQEVNAMYDIFKTDFVIIAPAYPKNGRKVIDGVYYLNGKKLNETEVAKDPKTPVNNSLIKELIESQSNRKVGHISHEDLNRGYEHILQRLVSFKNQNIAYITVDTAFDSDLQHIVKFIKKSQYSVIWCGSAGLMSFLPQAYGLKKVKKEIILPTDHNPVLLVVGSVSKSSREQLKKVLVNPSVVGIEMKTTAILLDNDARENELNRLIKQAEHTISIGKHLVLFSSLEVKETQKLGKSYGYNAIEISNIISKLLGELATYIIEHFKISNLFLTGGDIAYQVFNQLGVNEFHLIDEIETGIPLGYSNNGREIYAVTKAGGFGSESVMIKAILKLQGGNKNETSNWNYNG